MLRLDFLIAEKKDAEQIIYDLQDIILRAPDHKREWKKENDGPFIVWKMDDDTVKLAKCRFDMLTAYLKPEEIFVQVLYYNYYWKYHAIFSELDWKFLHGIAAEFKCSNIIEITDHVFSSVLLWFPATFWKDHKMSLKLTYPLDKPFCFSHTLSPEFKDDALVLINLNTPAPFYYFWLPIMERAIRQYKNITFMLIRSGRRRYLIETIVERTTFWKKTISNRDTPIHDELCDDLKKSDVLSQIFFFSQEQLPKAIQDQQ